MLELRDFDEGRDTSGFVHLTAHRDDRNETVDDFVPPRKIKSIVTKRGHKECNFTLEMVANKFVKKVLTQHWEEEGDKRVVEQLAVPITEEELKIKRERLERASKRWELSC